MTIYTLFWTWNITLRYVAEEKLKNKFMPQSVLTPIGSHTNHTPWFFIVLLRVC